jgi:homoserine dehydrogenase
MTHYRLAMLGFGNVGKSLARLLLAKEQEIASERGLTFSVTGIYTSRHGCALDPAGIDLRKALEAASISELSKLPPASDGMDFVRRVPADVLFENSPVNYDSGQPAVDHIRTALSLGMHAVTANKGPVVHAHRILTDLARAQGKKFYFESAVMDGCPIFSLFRETLPAARLLRFRGVLNSTTNMILSRMEAGDSFETAVAYCQEIGIAETDPSGDIDGWDAAVKVTALANVLMDAELKPQQVIREGIRRLGPGEVLEAKSQNKRWKLVCSAERSGRARSHTPVIARVSPELVGPESPLYRAEGTTSIVQFETDVLGQLTILEENPGPHTTAYGCLADFLNAVSL